MVDNYKKFIKENDEHKDVDPYGEENWKEKPYLDFDKDKMVSDCLDMIYQDMSGYRDWIMQVINNYFNDQSIDYLKEFLNYEYDEPCEGCDGTGIIHDEVTGAEVECGECNGEGEVDIYEYKYGKK